MSILIFIENLFCGTRDTLKKIIKDNRIEKIKLFKRGNRINDIDIEIKYKNIEEELDEDYYYNKESILKRINNIYLSRIKRNANKMEFEVLEDFKKDIGINMEKQFTNNPTFMM